nr:hypothetical protein Itr_chr13CG12270 [Ipomoea trifida]
MGPLEIPFDSFTLWTVSHRRHPAGDVSDRSSTVVLVFNGTEREKMRRSEGGGHGRDSRKRDVAICPSRFNSAPLSPLSLIGGTDLSRSPNPSVSGQRRASAAAIASPENGFPTRGGGIPMGASCRKLARGL